MQHTGSYVPILNLILVRKICIWLAMQKFNTAKNFTQNTLTQKFSYLWYYILYSNINIQNTPCVNVIRFVHTN